MKKTKIFIVEDDESLVKIIAEALGDESFEVSLILPAESSIKKIAQQRPGVVVLDIMLPGESGFEFLEKLKKNPETKDIPVVILSNLGQDEEIRKGLALGAVDYLVKADFTIYEIVHKITKAIKKK